MKLLRTVQHIPEFDKGVVATIGNFDGVHLGHQNLLNTLKNKAVQRHWPLVVVLFEPQPREYFQKDKAPARLSSLREKLDSLRQCGVDYVYCIPFNSSLAQTNASDFARVYLFKALNVRYLMVGDDFRFGKNREGDVSLLASMGNEFGCFVEQYSDFRIKDKRVSSTQIRLALQQGDLDLAAQFLGRAYSMCGRVIRGDGRGRQWGIPTANLALRRISLPLHGVFVVEVRYASQTVYGVANIGKRPTIDGIKNVLEVHLFDFDRSIYGELLQVFFLHKIRDEVKFTTVDALIEQIYRDIAEAREFLRLR